MEERMQANDLRQEAPAAAGRPMRWHYALTWVILWCYALWLLINGVVLLQHDPSAEIENWELMQRYLPNVQRLLTGYGVFVICLGVAVIAVRFMLARRVRGARMTFYVVSLLDLLWKPLMPLLIWLAMWPMTQMGGTTVASAYARYDLTFWIDPAVRAVLLVMHIVYYHKRGAAFAGKASVSHTDTDFHDIAE